MKDIGIIVYCVVMFAVLCIAGVGISLAGMECLGGVLCLIGTALLAFSICVGISTEK